MADPKDDELRVIVCTRKKAARRKANSLLEEWAHRALLKLAADERFSERDQEFGESLAAQLPKLSELQWPHAVKLAQRYQDHVAPPVDPRQQDLFSSGDKPK